MGVILVMGVSGSGKSTVGEALARVLGWDLIEADRYHPAENIRQMAAGIPLTDADRAPWLARLREVIDDHLAAGRPAVLACSALREGYRQVLRAGRESEVPVVYLKGGEREIRQRLEARQGHYMGPDLLASQLATLEEPRDAVVIPIHMPVDEAVAEIRGRLGV